MPLAIEHAGESGGYFFVMILIAPIYLDAAILPHFLRHYSELGIREFHFAVHEDDVGRLDIPVNQAQLMQPF